MAPVRRRHQRGYTLIEILTATAILAALLAIGVPNLVSLGKPYALQSAPRQIAADLADARMHAIATNRRYRVTFNAGAGTWVVERETAPGSGTFTAASRMQKLPHGATLGTITPGNPEFTPQGMLQQQVSIPITVSGAGTKTVTVNVLGKTTIS